MDEQEYSDNKTCVKLLKGFRIKKEKLIGREYMLVLQKEKQE